MAKLLCPASDPRWLELRRGGVTASDLPVIMGLVTWDSPWALYHRKRGLLPETVQTDRMRLGSWLEKSIAVHWRREAGEQTLSAINGLWQNDERPWQMATPDRCVLRDREPVAVLECKTSATRDGWGKCWTARDAECAEEYGKVPAYVRAQVLWQMDTLGVPTGHVAVVFLPSGEYRSYTIGHEDGCQADRVETAVSCMACIDLALMRKHAHEFYRRITGELGPPPVDHLTVTTRALQEVYAGLDDTLQAELDRELVDLWVLSRNLLRGQQEEERFYTNRVRDALGKAGVGTINGEPVIRRTVSKRAGYEVAPGVQDKLTRIKAGRDDSASWTNDPDLRRAEERRNRD